MSPRDVYVVVFDGFADWEPAHVLAELRREGKREIIVVGFEEAPVRSMGGMRVLPDRSLAQVEVDSVGLLLLPGGDMWEPGNYPQPLLGSLLRNLAGKAIPIAAICGGTLALARAGLLNDRRHTSTVPGDLATAAPAYSGAAHYVHELAVTDRGVITASGLGSVDFAREVFATLRLFSAADEALWFSMYKHGRLPSVHDETGMSNPAAPSTSADTRSRRFYHGTRADLKPGDLIQPGYSSNYTERRSPWVYFSETLNAATWGAELAKGEGPGRIYLVEPTGSFMDDPNLTDKKFPGNPTKSYRSREPLRVVGDHLDWQGHSPEEIQAMKNGIAGLEPIDD